MIFKFDSIPEEDIVKEIEEKLKTALVEEDINKIQRDGKTIEIDGDVPRRFVRTLVRKFLGKTDYKNNTRVIVTKPGVFEVFYYGDAE